MKQLGTLFALLLAFFTHQQAYAVTFLEETHEIEFSTPASSDLKAKADELATPVNIYEYVRNTIEYSLYHGSRSGSINTFLGERGSDVDIASTLIAMLRSQGIPARYAVGDITVPSADVMNWLGVINTDLAASIMDNQGIQNVVLSADKATISFEHVWVEALVGYDNYRGAGQDVVVDCSLTPEKCHWVSLDASYKLRQYHNQNIDIYNAVSFDYTGYYNAIKNNDARYQDKSPREIYEETVLEYLRVNHPGKTLEDVADPGVIIPVNNQILPASLPYTVTGPVRRYRSVEEYDANVTETKTWRKTATIRLVFGSSINLGIGTVSLVDLSTKRFTLTYELGSPERLVARLDGVDFAVPITTGSLTIGDQQVGVGYPFSMVIDLDGAPSTQVGVADSVVSVQYDNLIVGGYYLIATGDDTSNYTQVHRAAEQLLAANEQFPIVNDVAGIPYVDANANGVVDTGEARLLDSPDAQDALTGGLLYSAMSLYFARFRDDIRRLDALNNVVSPIEGFVGVVSSVYEVEYLDGTPFSVLPGGLLIDMKGQQFAGVFRNNAPETFANDHFELIGHTVSSLEHEIWQELTGYDAISTVRGIQRALADGSELLDLKKTATEDTLPAAYPALGFTSGAAPAPFQIRESELYGTQPTTWFISPAQADAFETFLGSVSPTTEALRLNQATYNYISANSGVDAFVACVDNFENQLTALIAAGSGNATASTTLCDGTAYTNVTINALQAANQDYYLNTVIPLFGQTFFDYFDRAKGFQTSAQVFRNTTIPLDQHATPLITQLRNNIYLVDPAFRNEYLIPSSQTVGDTYRFGVYLRSVYDTATEQLARQSYIIQNNSVSAGGGYVDGSEALVQAEDTTGQLFNNEVFTDQNLVTATNNDLIQTPSTLDPISTVTGNMYRDETDITIKGRGLNIAFTRTYNSGPTTANASGLPMGHGWTHSYSMRLVSNDYGQNPNYDATLAPENANGKSSSVTYIDERGGEVNYLLDDTGATPSYAVTAPQRVFDNLELDTPSIGQATVTFRNGVKYIFDGGDLKVPGNTAQLIRMEDPYGNELLFGYTGNNLTSISDNLGIAGRTGLSLTYTPAGQIETITDWDNRQWSYTYDADGNLTSATNPLSQTVSYTYQAGTHFLTRASLPADRNNDGQGGDVAMLFDYYRNGKAFMDANSLGEAETLDFNLYRKNTRLTDPRGFVREFYYDANGALTKLINGDKSIQLFENNAEGLRFKKTDALGFTTQYAYTTDRLADQSTQPSDTFGKVTLEQDHLGQTVEYDYGIFDQPTRVKDKRNIDRTTTYYTATDAGTGAVRGKARDVRVVFPVIGDVVLESYTYNPDGTLSTKKEFFEPGNTTKYRLTEYDYDPAGLNVTEMRLIGSGQTIRMTFGYDALGRRTSETLIRRTSVDDATPLSLTTTTEYDSLGRPVKVTDPLGNEMITVYDDNGKVTQITGRYKQADSSFVERVVTRREYDNADRLIKETDINDGVTAFTYDRGGNLTAVTDANNHTTRYEYDALNRRTATIDANGYRTEAVYDLAGRMTATVNVHGARTRYEYDALGRRTKVITPLGFEAQSQFDANNNVTHVTDANGVAGLQAKNAFNATAYTEYDALNRPVRIVDAQNNETQTTYDLLGNITSITDAEGRTTVFVYDNLGRLIETRDPLVQTPSDKVTRLGYDEAGNILTITDRKGQVTNKYYDVLNRTTRTVYDDAKQETMVYDIYGNITAVANNDVSYTMAYDNKNRLTQKLDTRLNKSLDYTYDAVDNVITKTDYQGEVTTFQYDSTNKLVAERNTAYLQVSYQYDGVGRLRTRTLSNGAQTLYEYDEDNRLIKLTNTSANNTIVQEQFYQYDNVGNITAITDATGTRAFTYDPVYRLLNANYPGTAQDQSYTYDKVGNRLTRTKNGVVEYYAYNANNRLETVRTASITGPIKFQFSYDDNGNTITKADGAGSPLLTFTYDAQNRVMSIDSNVKPSPVNSYAYDPMDYRILKQDGSGTQRYHLENDNLEATYDENGNLKAKYLRGVVVDEIVNGYVYDETGKATNYTYHHDHLNSVTSLTGHAGTTEQTAEYGPFGDIISQNGAAGNDLQYTGRELDRDTGLYYYRARYYDPEIGRFLQEDPLGFQAGINFYAYVGNNPIKYNDPSGMYLETALDIAFIAYDLEVIRQDGLNWTNGLALGLDVIGAALPFVTGGGAAVHGVSAAASASNEVKVVGRLEDTSPYIGTQGHDVLNVDNWTPEINFDWVQQGINNRQDFLTASPINTTNLTSSQGWGTVYAQELTQLSLNGYVPTGNTLSPGPYTGTRVSGLGFAINAADQFEQSIGGGGDILNPFASGGFVIYPNKQNTNTLEKVYSK